MMRIIVHLFEPQPRNLHKIAERQLNNTQSCGSTEIGEIGAKLLIPPIHVSTSRKCLDARLIRQPISYLVNDSFRTTTMSLGIQAS